mgnify:CR=1 FL=1
MARLLADAVSRSLGQSLVVRTCPAPRASWRIRRSLAPRPTAIRFSFTNTSGMAINLISFKQLPYDPTRDFTASSDGVQPRTANVVRKRRIADQDTPRADGLRQGEPRKTVDGLRHDGRRGGVRRQSCSTNEPIWTWSKCPYRSAAQMIQDVAASGVNQVMMSSVAAAQSMVDAGESSPSCHNLDNPVSWPTRSSCNQRNTTWRGCGWLFCCMSRQPAHPLTLSPVSTGKSGSTSRVRKFSKD